ncbi:MAG: DUF4339 domain-containing protein [Bacteroidaceae bacterium]|nr:DUF4339 domain-containing protein [Bacteroidaceae bacterium]
MNDQNFFSVDRLVEFGMSAAIARQMIGSMNQTMQTMYVPGSIQSMPQPAVPAPQPIYYLAVDGRQVGPLGDAEFARLVAERKVTPDTLGWMPGMQDWKPVQEIPAMLRVIALTPPPLNDG